MLHVKKMYKHLQNSMMNLVKVAETRFHKLEQGLQLRGFENECNKVSTTIFVVFHIKSLICLIWLRHFLNFTQTCNKTINNIKKGRKNFLYSL